MSSESGFVPENQILDASSITKMIRRMAFEIYEDHFEDKRLVLAGIAPQGFLLAKQLLAVLQDISPLELELLEVELEKTNAIQPEVALKPNTQLADAAVVLVDDVLNTAKTTVFALAPFLAAGVKSIRTAILVDRSHHLFPVASNYRGYALSTTINQTIRVDLEDVEKQAVYLF
ncbi:MAG: phosphoribosyltransferase [Cytophagales bacterium]|nr:MAG: phosphoribosyltransferase [Cytophagales bacterium]TAF59712.1 MAG: phosphoribosyltransferase [Cytophagales bacterium]